MRKNDHKTTDSATETITELTLSSLVGKQSVRATFKLPVNAIALLSVASTQLGIKQKSLFDQLVEDKQFLIRLATQGSRIGQPDTEKRSRTYVLSRNSLSILNEVAKELNVPRDELLEASIQRLVPVISAEKEKQENRETIADELSEFLSSGRELCDKAGELLGESDPVYRKLRKVFELCEKSSQEIQQLVEKGKQLKQWF